MVDTGIGRGQGRVWPVLSFSLPHILPPFRSARFGRKRIMSNVSVVLFLYQTPFSFQVF